jgi:DNA repair protein RadC
MKRIPLVSLRVVRERTIPYRTTRLVNAQAVFELFRHMAEDLDREAMWVACLDSKNRLTCLSQVALGTLNAAPAHPREILKVALLTNAHAVITVHNHPSGDPAPSREDRLVTAQIKEAAHIVGITFLDHLIVGDGSYYSFADQGGL